MRFLRVWGVGKDNRLSSVSLAQPPPSLTALNPVLQHPFLLCQYQNTFFFLLISFFSLEQVPQWKIEANLQLDNAAKTHTNAPTNP